MKASGQADLALMGGPIPPWLFDRMKRLSRVIVEAIVEDQGTAGFLSRLSDPFWFQSFGAVIGMDWNSSGVTTAVTAALKSSLNPHARTLGLYVCGGKGKRSLQTPGELVRVGERTGLDGDALARASRLSAKVDSAAVQDGFQVYLHSFVVSAQGEWTVVQQGMKPEDRRARRYHWHSAGLDSFVSDPHAAVVGPDQGEILNLADSRAGEAQAAIVELAHEKPGRLAGEIARMNLPARYGIRAGDVDLRRLGAVLHLAQEAQTRDFEQLLLLGGLGPRTLQSLALVSEVISGTPTRFSDPARFAFAHGGKGAAPFPVPVDVYDETIRTLRSAVDRARMGQSDKLRAVEKLSTLAQRLESGYAPSDFFAPHVAKENAESWRHGGRSVHGPAQAPDPQLGLFDA